MQTLFQNGDEQINGDGGPDLGAHRVWRGAVKGFDAQMLLDPFEEEFDLPAAAIEFGNGQRGHGEVVGQKDQRLARFWIAIADAAHGDGIIVLGVKPGEHHGLVETQAGGFVHGAGVTAGAAEVLFGAGDEESAALMNPMPAGEVEIAAIHDVERASFPGQLVEDVDIMNTASGDNDDGGKVALEREQGVEFDGGLVPPKRGPRKERETEVNGGGVQRIGGGLDRARNCLRGGGGECRGAGDRAGRTRRRRGACTRSRCSGAYTRSRCSGACTRRRSSSRPRQGRSAATAAHRPRAGDCRQDQRRRYGVDAHLHRAGCRS